MAGPDIEKEAKTTADDVARANHDGGSQKAAETLHQHFQDLAKSGASTAQMSEYWNKVQEGLKGTNIIHDMALQYGNQNFDNLSQDGKITKDSLRNASQQADLAEQNAYLSNRLTHDAASTSTMGDRAFDGAMQRSLAAQVDDTTHHGGFLWLNNEHYINKDDIGQRVNDLNQQHDTAKQPFVDALTGPDGQHLWGALNNLSGGKGISKEGLDRYLSAAKDLGRPDSEIKLAQQMSDNWYQPHDKNNPADVAANNAITRMRGTEYVPTGEGPPAEMPSDYITKSNFESATGLTDAQLAAGAPKPAEQQTPGTPKPPEQQTPGGPKPPEQQTPGGPKPPEQQTPGGPKPPEQQTPGGPKPPEQQTPGGPKPPEQQTPGGPKPPEQQPPCPPGHPDSPYQAQVQVDQNTTLWGLAHKYGVSEQQIYDANKQLWEQRFGKHDPHHHAHDMNFLLDGWKLNIPKHAEAPTPPQPPRRPPAPGQRADGGELA